MDLNQASRETLLEIIAELRQRVESLEARLSGGGPVARMPGHKPAAKHKKPAAEEKKLRKKRQHGFARPRMEPTGRVVHAPESCPECHTALTGGWVQRTREVIDIPVVPAEVTEHVFIARTCPLCRKRRLPQDPLKGLAVGRQRLGANLVSLIVTLREEGLLPVRTIQWYLRTFHQLKLSVGAIVRAVHQVARQGGAEVGEVLEGIRSSPVVHADETGWREKGKNGYVWDFQHAHGAVLPAPGPGWEGGGRGLGRVLRRDSGERLLRSLPPLPRTQTEMLGPLTAGHSRAEGLVPGRRRAGPVGLGECNGFTPKAGNGRRPVDALRPKDSWCWNSGCWRCAVLSWKTRWQCKPSYAGGLSGTSRSCSSSCRIRRLHLTIMLLNEACATW